MKRPLFIKNTPIDEKRIDFIEKVVSRLAIRSKDKKTVLTPPYPISSGVKGDDVKGEVLNYLFPGKGSIGKIVVRFNRRPKDGVKVSIDIEGEEIGSSTSHILIDRISSLKVDVGVNEGDLLTARIESLSEKQKIKSVFIAMLWAPDYHESRVKQFLIEDMENEAIEEHS